MKKKVIAYLQTHWDREWYRTKEEFNLRLLEVFDEVLEELSNSCAPSFYFDGQVAALEDYLKFRPEKLSLIKKFIKEKKLFIGPFYVSSDSFLVTSKLMEKNLELGINYSRSLGQEEFLGYFSDSFGHSREVCRLLKKFDIDKALFWRGLGNIEADFLYNGINTVRLVEGYFFDVLHSDLKIEKKAELTEKTLDKIAKYSSDTLLLPIGGDHLKILKNASKTIKELNKYLKNYEIELSNPFEYFKRVKFEKKIEKEFLDNSANYILGGVYSLRIKEKIQNAILSNKLIKIEMLDKLEGAKYVNILKYAELKLIKNHAHDSIYGCSIDEVNRVVQKRFQDVADILRYIENSIKRSLKVPKGNEIGIYNLSNEPYSGVIRFESNKKIKNAQIISKKKGFPENLLYDTAKVPITEDFCTIYEQLAEISDSAPLKYSLAKPEIFVKSTKIERDFIENNFIKIEIKNGTISLTNKIKNEIFEDFINIVNSKDLGDSYNCAPSSPRKLKILKTKIIENGAIRSNLGIFYNNLQLNLILYNNSKNLEFEAKINNAEKNHKLQISFNLKNNIEKTVAGDLYTYSERIHNPNYRLLDNMPPKGREEVQTNTYPLQKWVWSEGLGIFTVGLNEYETYKNTISIALLRSTGIISNPKNPARFVPAGPPLEIPEAQTIGEIREKFMITFCQAEETEIICEKYFENYVVKIV